MKKLIIAICLLVLPVLGIAQDEITKELGSFSEVKAYDGLSIKLIKSDVNKAIIKGKNKQDVKIINKNGKLKIKMDISEAFDGYNTFIEIYHKQNIYVIDANEQAFIENMEPYKQTEIKLKAQEGGEIYVYLDVSKTEVKAITGGKVNTNGKSTTQDVAINTGGIYEGEKLITEQTKVKVNAGGNAEVNATDFVDADVNAGGTIDIYGKPKVIERKTFLGGTIAEY